MLTEYSLSEEKTKGDQHGTTYLLLVDDPETIRTFKEKTQGANAGTQTTNLNEYGVVQKSGWGQEPPQEVKNWMERIQKGLEDLQYTTR